VESAHDLMEFRAVHRQWVSGLKLRCLSEQISGLLKRRVEMAEDEADQHEENVCKAADL
jgi:hypothetical protein